MLTITLKMFSQIGYKGATARTHFSLKVLKVFTMLAKTICGEPRRKPVRCKNRVSISELVQTMVLFGQVLHRGNRPVWNRSEPGTFYGSVQTKQCRFWAGIMTFTAVYF